MIFLCLVITLQANPRHTPKHLFPGDYTLLANFQLDSLARRAKAILSEGERIQDFVIQLQALQLTAEVQIAKNQFDQAYATLHSAYQLSPDYTLLDHKLYLAGALSEVALLTGNTSEAIRWRVAYVKGMKGQGQCENEAWANKRLGRLYLKEQQIDSAKHYFERAMQSYEKMGATSMVQALRQEWGMVNLRKRNYLSAINCFAANVEAKQVTKDTLGIIISLKHLIEINEQLDQTDAVENYCHQIIEWAASPNFQIWQSGAFLKLGKIEEERNNIALAIEYYLQNQHILLATSSQSDLLHSFKAKRPVYQLVGDYNIPTSSRQIMKDTRVYSLLLFWIRMGSFDKAQALLDLWIGKEKETWPSIRTTRLAFRLQTESLRNQARFPEAVQSFCQLLNDQDLAPSHDPVHHRFMNFQTEAKESHEKLMLLFENQEQQRLLTQSTWQNRSLLGGILLALIVSGLLFQNNQERKKNNTLLSNKNKLIAEALSEKEVLIREVHHRVKNNLQVVSSLLNLHARKVEDPKALGAIKEGRDRVKSMAFIHQKLYQVDDVRRMAVPDYINDLTNYLFTSYQIAPEQIELTTNIQQLDLDVDTMVPMGLILNELISNSLKHAFPDGRTGQISVTFKQKADDFLLEVADTGVGMALAENSAIEKGFGYQLIHTFCKKLKGQIHIQNTSGTSIQFRFPKVQLSVA